jgi:hypothetical protein
LRQSIAIQKKLTKEELRKLEDDDEEESEEDL